MVLSSLFIIVSALLSTHFSLANPSLQKRAVSPNGQCGGTQGYTCQGSKYGNSCSKNNQCGSSSDYSYSELSKGCQPAYGYCVPRGSVSPDGSCGGSDGFICIGSNFGNSCGRYNLCGRDAGYSGAGCQPQYGYCAVCTTTVQPSITTSTKFSTTTSISTSVATQTATVSSGITTTTVLTTTTTNPVSTLVTTTYTATTIQTTALTTATTTLTVSLAPIITTISDDVFAKRDAPTYAGPPPPLRTQLSGASSSSNTTKPTYFKRSPAASAAGSAGLSCGSVFSTGFTTTTLTTTSTITSQTTGTSTSTTYTTVPLSTSTVTSVIVSVSSSITSTTSTQVITYSVQPLTATNVVTAYTTVPASTSVVVQPGGTYTKATENTQTNTCTYGRYFSRTGVSTDPTNNYQLGRNQCAALCDSSPQCAFFFFDRFDQGGSFTECLLDSQPFDPNQIVCGVTGTTLYYAGYNKQT